MTGQTSRRNRSPASACVMAVNTGTGIMRSTVTDAGGGPRNLHFALRLTY